MQTRLSFLNKSSKFQISNFLNFFFFYNYANLTQMFKINLFYSHNPNIHKYITCYQIFPTFFINNIIFFIIFSIKIYLWHWVPLIISSITIWYWEKRNTNFYLHAIFSQFMETISLNNRNHGKNYSFSHPFLPYFMLSLGLQRIQWLEFHTVILVTLLLSCASKFKL